MSTLLTELSAQAHTFSCEAAAAKAQAMGARGLQTAEEARAAAAGAEAEALRVSVYGSTAGHLYQPQHRPYGAGTSTHAKIVAFMGHFQDRTGWCVLSVHV